MLKYKLKPFLIADNPDYGILFDEIMNYSIEDLRKVIDLMKKVLDGKVISNSFSNNLVVVEYDSKIANITQFDELVGEEKTIDIYEMLCDYYELLKYSSTLNKIELQQRQIQ